MVNRIDPAPAMGETRDRGQCPHVPPHLSPHHPPSFHHHHPPSRIPGMTSGSPLHAGMGKEEEKGGGGEEITWATAASQLIERPLGG